MLAITTRNKLRSLRFSLPMVRARRYVAAQLATTPGLIRYVSAIASPTEFLTMTVWENRQAMFNFMSSGAHQEFMWMFTRWSASFWSIRWIPSDAEEGTWQGLSLRNLSEKDEQRWSEVQSQAPQLTLAVHQPGRMPGGRLADPSGCDVYAVTALVEAATPGHIGKLLASAQGFRRESDQTRLLRWNIGAVGPRSFWILTLWRANAEGQLKVVRTLHQSLSASWTMGWRAGEYEIGNWNGLRLRQLAAARSRELRMQERS